MLQNEVLAYIPGKSGKKDWAYAIIKEKILDGRLAPLSDVSEDDLMEELQISRTPIREAFQKLEKEGFVHIYPRKGTIVTGINADLIYQLFEMRFLNEPYMARQVCNFLPEEWLLDIHERFTRVMKFENKQEEMQYYTGLDRELHSTILQYNQNTFLINAMTNVIDHNHRIRIKTSYEPDRYIRSIAEHVAIINAYLARVPEQVEETMRVHIATSRKNALEYFLKNYAEDNFPGKAAGDYSREQL